jgi:FKBP-type peptidyl-prolyl cis-trans isomerase FkpA/FKBP-type peptidyl-prolyl cis-trans isomerase FklB
MRLRTAATLLGAATVLAACQPPDGGRPAALDNEAAKASYAIGRDMGQNLVPARDHLDEAAFLRGFREAMAEEDAALPQEDLRAALQSFSQTIQEEQQAEMEAAGQQNQQEGEEYLAQNADKPGVTVTDSGLQYEVLEEGDGPRPSEDDTVTIQYRGTLIDGTEFDSSYERGEPATFPVGGVIPGFSEALQLMPVGSKYRVVIPGELAYGAQGAGQDIGPNATLIFEIELLGIGADSGDDGQQ